MSDGRRDGKTKDRKEDRVENANPYLSEEKWSGKTRRTLNFTHNMHERPAMQAANEVGCPFPLKRHMLTIS